MLRLTGYKDFELINETDTATAYRAYETKSGASVIIKLLKIDNPSSSDVARLKHEYRILSKIDLEGIIKVLAIRFSGGRFALITEDFRGISLREYLAGALALDRFLDLAIRLTDILGNVHCRNIAHQDLKPSNILYNPEKNILKLTDFGIAAKQIWPRKQGRFHHAIEGSLAYMSPEQTGRMNCGVDYRTDFYSLGITFYEMLTGGVPFASEDPMEVIHAHMAKMPIPVHEINPAIPSAVSDIIMRLLAKSAEARYQSCQGLLSDLQKCSEQLYQQGRIDPFPIGRQDISPRFNIPQMLVGRQRELDTLQMVFEQAADGDAVILMVTGEPGIGKSALVNEIHKPVVARRGYFISGKYDQLRQNVPFSGIIQAVQGLTRQLLTESEERLSHWKKRLLAALGSNGKVMTDIIADLKLIIGRQPEIIELSPEEAQNRFKMVLKRFFRALSEKDHPLVMFLDDLQWADPDSIDLIQTLILDRELGSLLLIGAYRYTEVATHHPLMLGLDRIAAAGVSVKNIRLEPLDRESINSFISEFLRCPPNKSLELAAIVHRKTLGNPFFINQFLKQLYDDGFLTLDPAAGWRWDTALIQKMQVTDNVVGFMSEKLRRLDVDPLSLIKIAACIGNRFDVETLAAVSQRSMDTVLDMIDGLVREGLINFRDNLYRFHHDRIHEAAYLLLKPGEKQRLHYQIGRLALENASTDTLQHRVFYIADQLNNARGQLADSAECLQLADLNLKAGIKAKEATAYEAAVAYLSAGVELLPDDAWQAHYTLTYALYTELMECRYLAHNLDQAESLFKTIIANASGKIDKTRAYSTMITLYTCSRTPFEAISLGIEALRVFGVHPSLKMGKVQVLWELIKLKLNLRSIALEEIIELPLMTDEERCCYNDLIVKCGTPAYFLNPNLLAWLILKSVNESLKHGLTAHAAVSIASLASIMENALGDYELGFKLGKLSLRLDRKMNNKKFSGMVHHLFAYLVQHWNRHAKYNLPVYRRGYRLCMKHGDFIFAGYSVNALTDCRLCLGDPLEDILRETAKYKDLVDQIKDHSFSSIYDQKIQLILALQGVLSPAMIISKENRDESLLLTRFRQEKNFYGLCYTLLPKIRLLYYFGRYEDARMAAEEVDRIIYTAMGTLTLSQHYFYYSLILTALLALPDTPQKGKLRRIIARNQRKLAKWTAICPENFRHKYDLVKAELTAAGPRNCDTLEAYHAAVKGAHEQGYVNEEALACERLALYYYRHFDVLEEARTYMQRAHQCYGYWGATAKQRHLEENFAALLPQVLNEKQHEGRPHITSVQTTSGKLDLATVMQVAQALSSEIMLDQLLQKTMQLSIANAGAERGFLILADEADLMVEAHEDLDQKEPAFGLPIPLAECQRLCHAVVNLVFRSREPVILADAAHEGPFVNDAYIAGQQTKSLLCMPIVNKGQLTGILYMENNLTANAFTEERLEILGIIASQAAISLENARLFELATTDGLTKLFVHRYFQFLLSREMDLSRRYDRTFTLVMLDIDNFKRLNDTYGHQVGDEVIRRLAGVLRDNIRAVDIAARYGGEEFVLILPDTDLAQALIVSEKIRHLVEKMSVSYGEKRLTITVSLGVATFPHHATDKEGLISSADAALYTSKRMGRNRVSVGEKINPERINPIRNHSMSSTKSVKSNHMGS